MRNGVPDRRDREIQVNRAPRTVAQRQDLRLRCDPDETDAIARSGTDHAGDLGAMSAVVLGAAAAGEVVTADKSRSQVGVRAPDSAVDDGHGDASTLRDPPGLWCTDLVE